MGGFCVCVEVGEKERRRNKNCVIFSKNSRRNNAQFDGKIQKSS
jgi:hypothetical protein